jgi:hypothetical protein
LALAMTSAPHDSGTEEEHDHHRGGGGDADQVQKLLRNSVVWALGRTSREPQDTGENAEAPKPQHHSLLPCDPGGQTPHAGEPTLIRPHHRLSPGPSPEG